MPRQFSAKTSLTRIAANEILGKRISLARKLLKLSQAKLSKRTGITEAMIHYIEAGGILKVQLFEIVAIAGVLGYTVDELVRNIPTDVI